MAEQQDENDIIEFPELPQSRSKNRVHKWRSLAGFWLLGLCNNYGYIAVLTGATDILQNAEISRKGERQCTYIATGAILLADIIPCLCVKAVGPFLPFFPNIQVAICVIITACAFITIATFSYNIVISMVAIVLISFVGGLGDITFLQYSAFYNSNVIGAWSSGTGGAGLIGSVSYTFLTRFLNFSTTFYILTLVPIIMALSFWIILSKPKKKNEERQTRVSIKSEKTDRLQIFRRFFNKLFYVPFLLKYIVPFSLVYFFEYFINQTTFELVNFENSPIKDQYKWLFVDYQLGVFISRTAGSVFHIRRIWILMILQFLNCIVFIAEVMWYIMPCFWTVMLLALWEGLVGGATYVNTYYRISTEITDEDKKRFALAVTGNGDSLGVTLAGVIAMYVHNAICNTPKPHRWIIR